VWHDVVRYTLEPRVFLCGTYVKYGSARKCRQKFCRKFHDERVPNRQTIHSLVNKLRKAGWVIDKKQIHKRRGLTEGKIDDIGARLEHTPRKSQKRLDQETRLSKSNARTATQLLKLRPYKITVIHYLQPRDPAIRIQFCIWFLQSDIEGGIDPQLTFLSDEA
jgi:hypothetical protein